MNHTLPLDKNSKELMDSFEITYEVKGNIMTLTYPVNEHSQLCAVIEAGDTWIIKEYATIGTGA